MTGRERLRDTLLSASPLDGPRVDAELDAYRAAVLREAADAVWANRAISWQLEIEGWEGAHALLQRMAAANPPTSKET